MTRVLRAITRLNIGGPARQALLLTRELKHDYPTVLAAGTPPEHEGELSDPNVVVRRVPLVRPVRPASDLRAFTDLRRLLVANGSGILHTHLAKAGAIGRAAAATVRPRPRTVHTFHGHVLDGYFSAPVERAFIEAERQLARVTDVLVAVSHQIRDQLLELGIGQPQQWRVIPLGFELEPLLEAPRHHGRFRAELGIGRDDPLVGVVGRLAAIKDHETLLQAMVCLPQVHLAIVGDGELGTALKARTEELGLTDRIHFTGWRHDLPNILGDLDLAVLTSRNEGTPVSLIEAHAAGVAAVATDVGGVSSVVRDGISGQLVPAGHPQAVAEAVGDLLARPDELRHLGQAGRTYAKGAFSHGRLLRDIRQLYSELTG